MELADLVSLQRSAAMLGVGQKMPVDRDELLDMCSELVECRRAETTAPTTTGRVRDRQTLPLLCLR